VAAFSIKSGAGASEVKTSFVNKKKQKNFVMLGHGRCR
jgi:hypothetical protein